MLPVPRALRAGAASLARRAAQWCDSPQKRLSAALGIGAAPVAFSLLTGLPGHQWISAVLLAVLSVGLAVRTRWVAAVLTIAVTFCVHSVIVIAAADLFPERCRKVVPDGEEYWRRQLAWIRTGQDPEYELSAWAPAHAQLLGATLVFSYTSLGGLTFYQGFYEVDLMNYYNGRLAHDSVHPAAAVAFGWHLWSLFRGVGYLLITYEVIAVSAARLTGAPGAPWSARWPKLGAGLGFVLADAAAKWALMESVRQKLVWALG